jgi:hypothetical protein
VTRLGRREQAPPLRQVWPRPVRRRLGQDFDAAIGGIHRQQTKPREATQAVGATITVAAPPRRQHGKPHLVRRTETLDALEDELQRQGHLEFGDDHHRRLAGPDADDVTAAHLALHRDAELLQEGFDGLIQRRLRGAGCSIRHPVIGIDDRRLARCPAQQGWRDVVAGAEPDCLCPLVSYMGSPHDLLKIAR